MEKKEVIKKSLKKNKLWIILVSILILIILITSGTKIFLYLNFLLGNDFVVKLDVAKEYIYMIKGQEEKINFDAFVRTNPFCKAVCDSEFMDISENKIIEKDSFEIGRASCRERV